MGVIASRAVSALNTVIRSVLATGLFLLSLVTPRDNTVWVFGAKGGEAFVDNSKYLFLYTVADREHIRAVWLSRDDDVVTTLQKEGYEAYHTNSVQGMRLNLRAGYVFLSHGMPDVNRWCSGGATTVLLWHGIALKQIGRDGYKQRKRIERVKRIIKDNVFDRYDWILVPSEAMVKPFFSAFRISPERILPIGYPRNDVLAGSWSGHDPTADAVLNECYAELHRNGTVLLYMPTKHYETSERVVDQLRLFELDQWLAERDAYFLVKPHPAEPFDLGNEEFSRIISVPDGIDIYPLLQHTDMLITDYSSIYFDYLLLDKPIVFYPFDLEQYRSTRGFYLDYEEVTPGPISTNFDDLLKNIENILETDEYTAKRKSVRETFLQPTTVDRCKEICNQFDPRVVEPIRG